MLKRSCFSSIVLIVLVFFYKNVCAQGNEGYEITGYVEGLKEGEKVTMNMGTNWLDAFETRDSAYVKNGVFHIKGIVPNGPRLYEMDFDQHDGNRGSLKVIRLFIDDNEKITIKSKDINKIDHSILEHHITIEGSPTNHSFQCVFPVYINYSQNMGRLNGYIRSIQDSIGFNEPLLDGVFGIRDEMNKSLFYNFFGSRNDSDITTASIFLMYAFKQSGNAQFWVDVYKELNDKVKNSFYGKKLKDFTRLSVNQYFPTCNVQTPEGKTVDLKDIISKGKVTIVQFWADQSVEREKLQEELKFFYKKYHERGLNVVGFSSDRYKEQWKESIERYQLPWHNVSDLKGKDGVVDRVYHEYGSDKYIRNTTNYLLDAEGKIIAYDPSGIVLQWYLKKAFGE